MASVRALERDRPTPVPCDTHRFGAEAVERLEEAVHVLRCDTHTGVRTVHNEGRRRAPPLEMVTVPSSRLYLMAWRPKLRHTCLSRCRSAWTTADVGTEEVDPSRRGKRRSRDNDSSTTSASTIASRDIEISQLQCVRCPRCRDQGEQMLAGGHDVVDAVSIFLAELLELEELAEASTAVSGVRSSWLILLKNSSFACVAAIASSRAPAARVHAPSPAQRRPTATTGDLRLRRRLPRTAPLPRRSGTSPCCAARRRCGG